jgi:hypothetical protein
VPHTIPFLMSIDETSASTRTPMDDRDYQAFRFNGKLGKLTVTLEPERTAAGEVGVPPKK